MKSVFDLQGELNLLKMDMKKEPYRLDLIERHDKLVAEIEQAQESESK